MPLRKVLLMSNWCIGLLNKVTIFKTIVTVVGLITGPKVSKKSTPRFWVNPFATSLALCLSIVPSVLYLVQKTHLLLTKFIYAVLGTKVQILFLRSPENSSFIALCHIGCWSVEAIDLGVSELTPTIVTLAKGTFCLMIPIFLLVTIRCKLTGGSDDAFLCTELIFVGGSACLVYKEVEVISKVIELLGKAEEVGNIYLVDGDSVFEFEDCESYLWSWTYDCSTALGTKSRPFLFSLFKLETEVWVIYKGK